jgi:hypothetical protein
MAAPRRRTPDKLRYRDRKICGPPVQLNKLRAVTRARTMGSPSVGHIWSQGWLLGAYVGR